MAMGGGGDQQRSERKMGAIGTAVVAVVGLVLSWFAIEVAFKPYLESGRAAMDRSLKPDYDPDDELEGSSQPQESPSETAAPPPSDDTAAPPPSE